MKKIILLIILLLFSSSVLAQSFSIRTLNYDPETGNTRLRIQNIASTDFHDIKIKIDNGKESLISPFLETDSAFATFKIISPGEHSITLTTAEGITETKKLYFSPSEEQLKEIIARKREIREKQSKESIKQKLPEKKFNYKYIYIPLILITAIIIFYLIYKKFKSNDLQTNKKSSNNLGN